MRKWLLGASVSEYRPFWNLSYVVVVLAALAGPFFSSYYFYFAPAMIVAGLILIIITGHKAALRIHEFGIFAIWTKPGALLSANLTPIEINLMWLSCLLVVAPIISVLVWASVWMLVH